MSSPDHQVVVHHHVSQPTNGFGLAGLILSCLGWITFGILSIPGALFSFIGMFSRGPKGLAVAGLIVGFPGVIFFLLVGLGMIAGMLSIGAAVETARTSAARMQEASAQVAAEADTITAAAIDDHSIDLQPAAPAQELDAATPDVPEPRDDMSDIVDDTPAEIGFAGFASSDLAGAIAPPQPMVREFSSADGRFRVRAEYLGSDGDTVQLRREDTGRELSVPIDRLSNDDQEWIAGQSAQQ